MRFSPEDHAVLEATPEVEIETRAAEGAVGVIGTALRRLAA